MKFIKILFIPLLMLLLAACSKEDTEPKGDLSDTPYIELQSVSPAIIQQFDSLQFTIFYRDGNGDLGYQSADSLSLWITDQRFPLTQGFHIPPLSPVDTTISIQGTFQVTLKNVILKDQSAQQEKVKFSIEMKDRSGQRSNVVESPEITIQKED